MGPIDISLVAKRDATTIVFIAVICAGITGIGAFLLGYNAGQSDVIAACVKNAEFQRGNDYVLCEIED